MHPQEMFDNMMAAKRAERMKTSSQLTLGELILKLENVKDKKKKIEFDFNGNHGPTKIRSWRGSYNELAIDYGMDDRYTLLQFIEELKGSIGKTYEGYKGGDFTMGKITPIWVAHWGESSIDNYRGSESENVGIVDIEETDNLVIIKTDKIDY
jgi:hypothetical protein